MQHRFSLNDFWKLGVWGDEPPQVVPNESKFGTSPESKEISILKAQLLEIQHEFDTLRNVHRSNFSPFHSIINYRHDLQVGRVSK